MSKILKGIWKGARVLLFLAFLYYHGYMANIFMNLTGTFDSFMIGYVGGAILQIFGLYYILFGCKYERIRQILVKKKKLNGEYNEWIEKKHKNQELNHLQDHKPDKVKLF